jgi:hypothetical protein
MPYVIIMPLSYNSKWPCGTKERRKCVLHTFTNFSSLPLQLHCLLFRQFYILFSTSSLQSLVLWWFYFFIFPLPTCQRLWRGGGVRTYFPTYKPLCVPADDVGDQLCERVLGVLYEIWLIACVKSFPSPTLWKTFREMCMNWRHRTGPLMLP